MQRRNKRRGGQWADPWTHLIFGLFCLWKNSAVGSTCWCFYACNISFHIPPTSWFCNSCVYTTLALLRSLAFSGNKATNISVKCWALASCLSFPLLFYKPQINLATLWPQVAAKELPEISHCAGLGEEPSICISLFWRIFSIEKKLFFELFQISYRHSCNLAEMGL